MAGYPPELGDVPEFPDNIRGFVGRKQPAQGAHDPLWVKAVVLDNGEQRVGIISIDTLIVTHEFTRRVRQAVSACCGIPPNNLLINTTHTHSGPDVFGLHSPHNETLENALFTGAVAAVESACAGMVEGKVGLGRGRAGEVVINRRDLTAETDQEIAVLRLDGPDDRPVAVVVKMACHPVILDYANLLFSADFCAYLYDTVEAAHPGTICCYLNGCAGNINPARFPYFQRQNIYIDQTAENYPVYWGGFEQAERTGRVVAYEVLRVMEEIVTSETAHLRGTVREVSVPLKSLEDRATFVKFLGIPSHFAERAMRADQLDTEVQALVIGDTIWIALPGEPFVETGFAIKKGLSAQRVIVLGYSNDDVRYILPSSAYRGDKYETLGTWLAPNAEKVLIDAAIAVGKSIH
jgi:hypothetical protein